MVSHASLFSQLIARCLIEEFFIIWSINIKRNSFQKDLTAGIISLPCYFAN